MKEVIYSKYSNERDDKFKIKTLILQDESKYKTIEKHALTPEAKTHIQHIMKCEKLLADTMNNTKFLVNKSISFDNHIEFEYLNGKTLANIIENEIANKNYDKVISIIEEYYRELNTMATRKFAISKEFESVFGTVYFQKELASCAVTDIDLIFANIVVENEKWHVIDYEWTFDFDIPINYVLFRAIKYSGNTRDTFDEELRNKLNIFKLLKIDVQEIKQYEKMESNFQKYVNGKITPLWHLLTKKNITLSDCLSTVQKDRLELFFDEGQGFSAEKKESLELNNNEINNYKFNISGNVLSLRIDPGNTYALVENLCIRLNGTVLDETKYIHNGMAIGENKILFVTEDPQIIIDNLQNENIDVELSLKVETLSEKTVQVLLAGFEGVKMMDERVIDKIEMLDNAVHAYEELKEEYIDKENAYRKQIDELNVRLYDTEKEYGKQINELNIEKDILAEENRQIIDSLIAEQEILKNEIIQLKKDYYTALNQAEESKWQVVQLQGMYESISNAACWKMTKPLRGLLDFMKRNKYFMLMYKGLASIKNYGFSVTWNKTHMYLKNRKAVEATNTSSEVADNMSLIPPFKPKSGYYSMYQDDQVYLEKRPDIKVLTFYLPQFHEIPENNQWWGEGFTEWVNTRKALPRFENHYQPRNPHKNIGYYDLSLIEDIKKQALLAKQHGIYGFCFYYYWFSGKRLLEKPLDLFLEHPEIDLHFCLCWANENWTRTWDGLQKNILMEQKYTEEDTKNFIKDIKKYTDDSRYIRIDGKPVIMVYNPSAIPKVKQVFNAWREYARKLCVGEILIWICRTPNSGIKELKLYGVVDKEVEFAPHNMGYPEIVEHGVVTDGYIYNYSKLVDKVLSLRKNEYYNPNLYRCAMLGWDNSARRKDGYTVFDNFDLKKYYDWLSANIAEAKMIYAPAERFTFINAWNEWAEGTYLEPDEKYGYANINTTSQAIYGEEFYVPIVINNNENESKIAIQMHIFFEETTEELIAYANNIPYEFDCYVSTNTMEKALYIKKCFREQSRANKIEIQVMQNRGRDVAPFIIQLQRVIDNYDYFCHIHSKKSKHFENGDDWRHYLLHHLLGSGEHVHEIIETFENQPNVGIMYPETYPNVLTWIVWGENRSIAADLLEKINCSTEFDDTPEFPAGNMFWARTEAVKQLFEYGFRFDDFPEEDGQLDLTLAHAIERSWYYIAKANGYEKKIVM